MEATILKRSIVLIRHGQTLDNERGVAQGWSDSALTELGLAQVRQVAMRLKAMQPIAIYSSTLPRARATAAAIAATTELAVRELPDLREMNCGEWEGASFEDLQSRNPAHYSEWSRNPEVSCPGGESYREVRDRMASGIRLIEEEAGSQSGTILVVSHGTAIRVAATALLDLPLSAARSFAQDNTAVNIFERRGERYVLKLWNDVTHCGGE